MSERIDSSEIIAAQEYFQRIYALTKDSYGPSAACKHGMVLCRWIAELERRLQTPLVQGSDDAN